MYIYIYKYQMKYNKSNARCRIPGSHLSAMCIFYPKLFKLKSKPIVGVPHIKQDSSIYDIGIYNIFLEKLIECKHPLMPLDKIYRKNWYNKARNTLISTRTNIQAWNLKSLIFNQINEQKVNIWGVCFRDDDQIAIGYETGIIEIYDMNYVILELGEILHTLSPGGAGSPGVLSMLYLHNMELVCSMQNNIYIYNADYTCRRTIALTYDSICLQVLQLDNTRIITLANLSWSTDIGVLGVWRMEGDSFTLDTSQDIQYNKQVILLGDKMNLALMDGNNLNILDIRNLCISIVYNGVHQGVDLDLDLDLPYTTTHINTQFPNCSIIMICEQIVLSLVHSNRSGNGGIVILDARDGSIQLREAVEDLLIISILKLN